MIQETILMTLVRALMKTKRKRMTKITTSMSKMINNGMKITRRVPKREARNIQMMKQKACCLP